MKRLIEAIEDWMVNYKRNTIKPSSYDRLRVSAILMSKHPVSDIPIDELTSDDLQEYVNELVDDGYALTTIRKQMHLISAYITYANLKGDILRPIHKGVGLPSESMVKKRKKEVVAYDKDEQKRLKEVFYTGESPIYYADILMMETGLRAGEALALGWNDIDWRRRAISINKTVVRLGDSKRSYVQNSAKSFTSNRVIPLSSEAYNLLESMRRNDKSSSAFVFHDVVAVAEGDLVNVVAELVEHAAVVATDRNESTDVVLFVESFLCIGKDARGQNKRAHQGGEVSYFCLHKDSD